MTLLDNHLAISRRFIRQAEEELASGDLLQASERAWGAAAHRLKAIARRRRWRHGSHKDFYTIIDLLADEVAQPEQPLELFSNAAMLHTNFYNDYMPERLVKVDIESVKRLLAILDGVA